MLPFVEYEVFRDHLGVAAGDPLEAATYRLLDAICAQVRRITRRAFEGDEGGSYTLVIRIRGALEFTLPHVPVRAIASIARVRFDGTVDDPYETTSWRLEDAERGAVRLLPGASSWGGDVHFRSRDANWGGPDYVQVVWTTTGDIPADLVQGILEWGKTRWDARDRAADLASYDTGEDAESYFASLAGHPPADTLRAIMGARHATGGGVV
jgi:hypothetical protein